MESDRLIVNVGIGSKHAKRKQCGSKVCKRRVPLRPTSTLQLASIDQAAFGRHWQKPLHHTQLISLSKHFLQLYYHPPSPPRNSDACDFDPRDVGKCFPDLLTTVASPENGAISIGICIQNTSSSSKDGILTVFDQRSFIRSK